MKALDRFDHEHLDRLMCMGIGLAVSFGGIGIYLVLARGGHGVWMLVASLMTAAGAWLTHRAYKKRFAPAAATSKPVTANQDSLASPG